MFRNRYDLIIAVQNDEVCWICGRNGDNVGNSFRMPLDKLFEAEQTDLQMPDWLKAKRAPLCIMPDHWLGIEHYPFKSHKVSLIESYLERKLITAHPGHQDIKQFFNYRYVDAKNTQDLVAVFFQEDKSFQLYSALENLDHPPHQITSPAFLWEEQLAIADEAFVRQGTLLIHHTGHQCHLYFYHKGHYQFSRDVNLSDSAEDLDALGFEINQSQYMFSQKAKSDLDCIYMLCDTSGYLEKLGQALGREIIDLKPLLNQTSETISNSEKETLNGLLQDGHISGSANLFSIMHRQVKKNMAWRPVQWVGILTGLLLLIGLAGEHFFLRNILETVQDDYRNIQQRIINTPSAPDLNESSSTLDQLLAKVNHSKLTIDVHGIPAHFPADMTLKEIRFSTEGLRVVDITAWVQAPHSGDLEHKLLRLIDRIRTNYDRIRPLTLKDIDIQLNRHSGNNQLNRYQIAFRLEWI